MEQIECQRLIQYLEFTAKSSVTVLVPLRESLNELALWNGWPVGRGRLRKWYSRRVASYARPHVPGRKGMSLWLLYHEQGKKMITQVKRLLKRWPFFSLRVLRVVRLDTIHLSIQNTQVSHLRLDTRVPKLARVCPASQEATNTQQFSKTGDGHLVTAGGEQRQRKNKRWEGRNNQPFVKQARTDMNAIFV
jgi:hypothetical protein